MPNNEHIAQDADEINKLLGTDRWLLKSGLVSDSVQQNLLLYGHLASTLVDDVEIALDVNKKHVKYWIYLKRKKLKKYQKFILAWNKYKDPTTIWAKWRKLRLYKKSTFMNIEENLERLVRGYIPSYTVEMEVVPYGQTRQSESAS